MGLCQEGVTGLLDHYGIKFQQFQHAPVMTADAQAEALKGAADAVVTKNLFLRDKKRRQYLITALPGTKVDLKVLSARLGCGKSGLSWAPEEALAETLQVEPGCVTPLALANASAKSVLLLLDSKLQSCGKPCFVHPIVNTASLLMDVAALDAFVRAIGRQPLYIDLEADPQIDRDNPPDLKAHADSVEPAPAKDEQGQQSSGASSSTQAAAGAAAGAAGAGGAARASKGAASSSKGKQAAQSQQTSQQQSNDEHHIALTNVVQRTDELIEMVAAALLGKPAAESGVDGYVLRRLKADVQMQLTAFKNAAYTAGYNAGKGEIIAFATKQYA